MVTDLEESRRLKFKTEKGGGAEEALGGFLAIGIALKMGMRSGAENRRCFLAVSEEQRAPPTPTLTTTPPPQTTRPPPPPAEEPRPTPPAAQIGIMSIMSETTAKHPWT